jgi:hypothetical protein
LDVVGLGISFDTLNESIEFSRLNRQVLYVSTLFKSSAKSSLNDLVS